jgi:hypothetical protein
MHALFIFCSIQPYWQLQSFFIYSSSEECPPPLSCGACHTLAAVTSCPSPSTLGEEVPPPPSLAGLFIYSSCEGVSPPPTTLVELSTGHPLLQAFPSPRLLGVCRPPAFSGWLVYLQFEWGVPLPHSPELRVPHPLCYVYFFFSAACLLFSLVFFSFFPG